MEKNPYTRDTSVPYLRLDVADWYIVTDLFRDGMPDVQIREIIALWRDGELTYRGYGQRMLVSGKSGERVAKFIHLDPDEIPERIKKALNS